MAVLPQPEGPQNMTRRAGVRPFGFQDFPFAELTHDAVNDGAGFGIEDQIVHVALRMPDFEKGSAAVGIERAGFNGTVHAVSLHTLQTGLV